MTDSAWLLALLSDGREHTLTEILQRSINERGHGLTTHSRVSDLRKRGHRIEHVTIAGASRGAGHAYKLLLDTPHREGDADSLSPVSKGWVTAHDPEHARQAATALNVAPEDSTGDGGSAASSAMVQDGGDDPGSVPTAALTLFAPPVQRERWAA